MNTITWHTHDEIPDVKRGPAVLVAGPTLLLLDGLYCWGGDGWRRTLSNRPVMVEVFYWAYEVDILNTLKAALEARHV